MENISVKQLSYILDLPKEKAFSLIQKALGKNLDHVELGRLFHEDPNPSVSIERFDKVHGLNIRGCIESLQTNFLHDKACIDFVFQDLDKKIKPDKKTMQYPKVIRLPYVITSILTGEQVDRLKELCRAQFATPLRAHKISIF